MILLAAIFVVAIYLAIIRIRNSAKISQDGAILSTDNAWNKPDIDFLNSANGKEGVERAAKRLNKKLYPKDYVWPDGN